MASDEEHQDMVGEQVDYEDPDTPPPTSWREIVRLHFKNFDFFPLWDIPGLSNRIECAIDEFLDRECTQYELRLVRSGKGNKKLIPYRLIGLFVLWWSDVAQAIISDAQTNQHMFWQDAVRKYFPEFTIPNPQINDDHRLKYSRITKAINGFFLRECNPEEAAELDKMARKRIFPRLLPVFIAWFGAPEQQNQFQLESTKKEVTIWTNGNFYSFILFSNFKFSGCTEISKL